MEPKNNITKSSDKIFLRHVKLINIKSLETKCIIFWPS